MNGTGVAKAEVTAEAWESIPGWKIPEKSAKVVSALMCPRSIDAKAVRWLNEWMVKGTQPHLMLWPPVYADHSGRVDVAFSVGFETARMMGSDIYFRFDEDVGFPLFQTDCPVHRRQDFDMRQSATVAQVIDSVLDCFRRGWDVVLGITIAESGNPILQLTDAQVEGISESEPFDVDGGGHGFCAVSGRILRELPPYAETTGQDGAKFRLWTEQNARETEDAVFNRWARDHAYRVCADPRINWGHRKSLYLSRKDGALDKFKEALKARPK